jgi:acyl carrier protein
MDDRIKKVMASVFGTEIAQIDESMSTDTLEVWDSLQHMTLIVALEEEFGIEFNNEEIVEMVSYPLIKTIIEEKLSKM